MNLSQARLSTLFQATFISKSEATSIQLIRYLCVGGIAAAIDFGTFMMLTIFFDQHYIFSQTMAFIAGISTNYTLSTLWIFESRHHRLIETSLFLLTGVIGLLLSYACLWLFIDIFSMLWYENAVAKILTTALVLLWNFSSRKWLVFK